MKALLYVAVFLAVFLASIGAGVGTVLAFDPWNTPNWPGVPPGGSPMTAKVGATAEVTWTAVDQYGWPGWKGIVSRALDTGSPDLDSYGNALNRFLASENRGRITVREARADETPDLIQTAAPTAFLEAKCGGDFATACVYLLSSRPVPAFYKAAAMIVWPYASQAPVIRHETHHPVALACDQYRGGCPRKSDGVSEAAFVCTGNPDSLMDCGGAARTVQRFDYETFKSAYPASTGFLQVQVPPPCGNPCWDGTFHVFADGWKFKPNAGCGEWHDPANRLFWGGCDTWGGGARWNAVAGLWISRSGSAFDPVRGIWYGLVPPPLP